ncbi:chalcone isomerase family protein [Desulfococcaceae bacterium OttesenSCG-928-F15]|nr:chalcone isomerase family protein [Desulfococcaceae bacterium OttesenSCG-928-F15]
MKKVLVFFLSCFFLASSAVAAQKVGDVTLSDEIKLEGDTLVLNGAGIRKKAVFKLYVGALYLKAKSQDAKAIIAANDKMSMQIHITSGMITKEKLLEAITDGFRDATGGNTAPLQERMDQLNKLFTAEIKKGDVIELAYAPAKGVLVSHNGKNLGSIAGLDFKQSLFAIWLGDKPSDKALRSALLAETKK